MRPTTAALISIFLQKGSKKWRLSQLLEQVKPLMDEAVLLVELEELVREGWLLQDAKGRYALNLLGRQFIGEVHTRHEEAYVSIEPLGLRVLLGDFRKLRLLPGEQVEVEIYALYPEQVRGRLIRRLAPSTRTFVGIVEEGRNRRLYVTPQQPPLSMDFQLPKETPSTLIGQKVAVRFLSWGLRYPIGEVVRVLGPPRVHSTEMHAILFEFDLPEGFPEDVLAEAAALPEGIPPEEEARRHDFRGIPTFTIDPEDAKDFDDAISLRQLPEGTYEVGIHIADVSYYVRPETALDREAYARGTSVYLVDRTIPMLPERLSTHLCSLRPNEDRLAFSVVFQMDAKARIRTFWMGRTLIRSQYRFTYEEAQRVLESGKGPFVEELRLLNALTHILHQRRLKEGGIRFETEEIRFRLDEAMRPVALFVKQRKDTHKLIEELMLLANRQVALFLSKQKGIPTVYRIHDMPKPDKLKFLQIFLDGFGYEINIQSARSLTRSLNELIELIEGKPEAHIIQSIAIRSMPKAMYNPKNIGHYGLGFTHYTHFTSPIRRYPDLLVHRILEALLEGKPTPYPNESHLAELCRHSSQREKLAEQAERASIRYKQLEYLSQMEGKEVEGLIAGIESWGLYVELSETRAEGLIPLRSLPTDLYERDSYGHVLKGRYTHRRYRLGDQVLVRIVGIDFDRRLVDLELIKHWER
ncbi:MAG: ribonuclease R [Bacteroidia bacterium]|nr:ribonuclease R [Bacteroidia bacterium]MDW8015125.1 ribonuclease R [Bacteroidia bacterium]